MQDQNYIVFESYLSNELSKDEAATFESRLKTEPEFGQAFKTYKALSFHLEHKFKNEEASKAFEGNLKNISNAYFEKQESPKKVIRFKPWQYAMAASVALLIGVFMFNNLSNPQFSDYNNYDSISLTVRGDNDNQLKLAEEAFNNKDFAKAEKAFGNLIKLDKENSELKLYQAISNIELGHYSMAEKVLHDLKKGTSVYKNKAIWYLSLSKLKQENYNSCLEILKTIPEDAEDFNKAKKLINKLD